MKTTNQLPKYKKELINLFYDTLAGNTNYPQIKPNQIKNCEVSYTEDEIPYMTFEMTNRQKISFFIQ